MEKGVGKIMTPLNSDYEIDILIDRLERLLGYNSWTEEE